MHTTGRELKSKRRFIFRTSSVLALAACALQSPAQAVEINTTTTDFVITNFGGPICEMFTSERILRGVVNDRFNRDYYHSGITDASGTLGINNRGDPDPQQAAAIGVGQNEGLFGFIDRANVMNPMFLTIWEGTPDPANPSRSIPGAIVAQIEIPQSALTAGPFPCAPLNSAPTAVAGSDADNIVPGARVTLDGTASNDPDNDTLTYEWVQTSGAAVTLDDPTSATPSFTAPGGAAGAPIVFQLIVNDGRVSSDPVTVSFSILDNVSKTREQIGDFMMARNLVLLSNQPDLQRRIDRLKGTPADNSSTVAGIAIPGSDRMPLSVVASAGTVSVSASLAATQGNRANDVAGSWDIWAEAQLIDYQVGTSGGSANIIYGGVDYAVSSKVLLGVMGQYDAFSANSSLKTGVSDGNGWMVGPYVTAQLSENLYFDARGAWGRSDNTVSPFGTYTDTFDTERVLVGARLTGDLDLGGNLTVRPEASVHWIKDQQNAYTDSLGSVIAGQSFDLGELRAGPRIMYSKQVNGGHQVRPFIEAHAVHSFGDYPTVAGSNTRLRLEGGVDFLLTSGARMSISAFGDGLAQTGYRSVGARFTLGYSF